MKIWRPVKWGEPIITEEKDQWFSITQGPDDIHIDMDASDPSAGSVTLELSGEKYQLCQAVEIEFRGVRLHSVDGRVVDPTSKEAMLIYEELIADLEHRKKNVEECYSAESEANSRLRETVKRLQVELEAKSREADDYLAQLVKLKREKLGDDKYNRGT